MDLGATVCMVKQPDCAHCPQHDLCRAKAEGRVHELPRKTARVAVQSLAITWAVVQHGQRIWLQQRPEQGIWAKLFCVPCFDDALDFQTFCRDFRLPESVVLPAFRHRLTHRALTITPHLFRLPETQKPPEYTGGVWVDAADWAQYALPKPLQQFLVAMFSDRPPTSKPLPDK